jgi:hypothetical protein
VSNDAVLVRHGVRVGRAGLLPECHSFLSNAACISVAFYRLPIQQQLDRDVAARVFGAFSHQLLAVSHQPEGSRHCRCAAAEAGSLRCWIARFKHFVQAFYRQKALAKTLHPGGRLVDELQTRIS